jgi:sigma-E factor negative regulatory protein RseC
MAQKTGRVTAMNKDGWAMVVTERDDACNNCESAQFCHSLVNCTKLETGVLNRANAKVGDRVTISLSSRSVFKSALILYILPTLGFIMGAFSSLEWNRYLGLDETGAAILFGFVGLLIGFAVAVLISKRQAAAGKLIPVITRIIQPTSRSYLSRIPAVPRHK